MAEEKEIKIKIDLEIYKKVKDLLEKFKLLKLKGSEGCGTVEDLISFYIENMFKIEFIMDELSKLMKRHKNKQQSEEIPEESSFDSTFDDEEEEDFDDEFYYYDDDDEELEITDKLERIDINSEEYKERQRKYEEEKKKLKK